MLLAEVLRAIDADIGLEEVFVGIVVSGPGCHSLIAVSHLVADLAVGAVAGDHCADMVVSECALVVNLELEVHPCVS